MLQIILEYTDKILSVYHSSIVYENVHLITSLSTLYIAVFYLFL